MANMWDVIGKIHCPSHSNEWTSLSPSINSTLAASQKKKINNRAKSSTNNSKVCLSVTKQQQALSIQDSCSCLDGPSAACTRGLLARLPMVPPVSLHRVTAPQAAAQLAAEGKVLPPTTSHLRPLKAPTWWLLVAGLLRVCLWPCSFCSTLVTRLSCKD